MDHGNRRDSNIAAEEIMVLGAISLVSARMARRLAALAKQGQPEEGGKHCEFGIYANPNLRQMGNILMSVIIDYAFDILKVSKIQIGRASCRERV